MLEEAFCVFSTCYSHAEVFCVSFIIGIIVVSTGIALGIIQYFED